MFKERVETFTPSLFQTLVPSLESFERIPSLFALLILSSVHIQISSIS